MTKCPNCEMILTASEKTFGNCPICKHELPVEFSNPTDDIFRDSPTHDPTPNAPNHPIKPSRSLLDRDIEYQAGRSALIVVLEFVALGALAMLNGALIGESAGADANANFAILSLIVGIISPLFGLAWAFHNWKELEYALMRMPFRRPAGLLIMGIGIAILAVALILLVNVDESHSTGRRSPGQAIAFATVIGFGALTTGCRLLFGEPSSDGRQLAPHSLRRPFSWPTLVTQLFAAGVITLLIASGLGSFPRMQFVACVASVFGASALVSRRLTACFAPPVGANVRRFYRSYLFTGLSFGIPFGLLASAVIAIGSHSTSATLGFGIGSFAVAFVLAGSIFARLAEAFG